MNWKHFSEIEGIQEFLNELVQLARKFQRNEIIEAIREYEKNQYIRSIFERRFMQIKNYCNCINLRLLHNSR